MEPRDHQRLVAVLKPGCEIALHDAKCGVFQLFVCLFSDRMLPSLVAQGSTYKRRGSYRALHNEDVAHKNRSVATAAVLLFRGVPRIERSER